MATVFERVTSLLNTVTLATFACKVNKVTSPYQFRTALVKSVGASGAIDAHAGARDPIDVREVTITIVHVYNQNLPPAQQTPGLVETYSTVYAAFDAVCGSGYPVTLTQTDAAGNLWYNTARVKDVQKAEALTDVGGVEITVTFSFFTPYWAAQYKAGVLRYDETNPVIYYDQSSPVLHYDADPDNFALSGTSASHTVSNSGVGGGTVPDTTAGLTITAGAGGITGPITVANGSVLAFNGNAVYLSYSGNLAAGEILTIDGVNQDCTSSVIGAAAYQNLAIPYANGQDSWFVIGPGSNSIVIVAVSLSGTATINYAPLKQ